MFEACINKSAESLHLDCDIGQEFNKSKCIQYDDDGDMCFVRRGSVDIAEGSSRDTPDYNPLYSRRWSINPDHFHNRRGSGSLLPSEEHQEKTRSQSDQKLCAHAQKRVSCQHVRWADDCQKDLVRTHPRKRYNKKPVKPAPLKPILKPGHCGEDI